MRSTVHAAIFIFTTVVVIRRRGGRQVQRLVMLLPMLMIQLLLVNMSSNTLVVVVAMLLLLMMMMHVALLQERTRVRHGHEKRTIGRHHDECRIQHGTNDGMDIGRWRRVHVFGRNVVAVNRTRVYFANFGKGANDKHWDGAVMLFHHEPRAQIVVAHEILGGKVKFDLGTESRQKDFVIFRGRNNDLQRRGLRLWWMQLRHGSGGGNRGSCVGSGGAVVVVAGDTSRRPMVMRMVRRRRGRLLLLLLVMVVVVVVVVVVINVIHGWSKKRKFKQKRTVFGLTS